MFQIIGLFFWLVIIPFCIGLVPAGFTAKERRSPAFIFLAGYFTMWALYGVVTIPVVLFVKYDNFILTSNCFLVLSVLAAAAGVYLTFRRGGSCAIRDVSADRLKSWEENGEQAVRKLIRNMFRAERIEWLLFFVLLCFQLYKAVAYASNDGDDAYYVVESLIAQQADTMYSILPYTGRHTGLDIRHALAVFPMWIAFVAQKCDIHATILSHTIMPLALIPLTYLVYYEIGKILFRGSCGKHSSGKERRKNNQKNNKNNNQEDIFNRENLPLFMILTAVFQIFGNVSIYTTETFFLTRTWQGKSVAGSLVIPAMFWLFLMLYDGAGRKQEAGGNENPTGKRPARAGIWFLLVCANITAGICSSIAVFLVSILMAAAAVCLAFAERDYKLVFKMGAVCIPNAVYVLTYLIVGYGHLLR